MLKDKISKLQNHQILWLICRVLLLIASFQIAEYVFMLLGTILGYGLMQVIPAMALLKRWPGSGETFSMYFAFIGIWIITIIFLAVVKPLRPILKTFWTRIKGNTTKYLLLGLLIGLCSNVFCALAAILHGDIALSFNRFELLPFVVLFIAVFIQSSAEEIVCRSFVYQVSAGLFKQRWILILANPIIFTLGHASNPGVTPRALFSVFLAGVLLTVMVYYFDSLWMAFGFHAAWNFSQSILLGLPNSGLVVPWHVMKLDSANDAAIFFYDAGFGIEGSFFCLLVLAAIIVCIIFWGEKKKKRPTNIWAK